MIIKDIKEINRKTAERLMEAIQKIDGKKPKDEKENTNKQA